MFSIGTEGRRHRLPIKTNGIVIGLPALMQFLYSLPRSNIDFQWAFRQTRSCILSMTSRKKPMFGRSGVTYLAREREIIAGRARTGKTYRHFLTSLMTTGILVVLLAGAIVIRLAA
jgi:hypothetical protein